jgi:predicted PurR-regulated permease PerM
VLIGGVCVWALLMVLELVTRNTAFLYAAIVVIVLQVVLSATLRRQ